MSFSSRFRDLIATVPAVLARPALALLLGWLGLIKLVPSLDPAAGQYEEFAQLIAGGPQSGNLLLAGVGVLQLACAVLLLIPRLRLSAAVLLLAHLVGLLVVVILHIGALRGATVVNGTGLMVAKTMVLLICGLALLAPPPPTRTSP